MIIKTNKISRFLVPLVAALGFASLIFIQRTIDSKSIGSGVEYLFIPEVRVLKHFTFGFDHILADIYWLRSVQYAAEKKYTSNGLTWMERSLDLITTLDGKFETAYLFGGIILASDREFVGKSIQLLKKGMENIPGEWRFPFNIGFDYFFHLQESENAARYIMMASRMKGAPTYLPLLATRLLAEANKPETALDFLEKMYHQTEDEILKARIAERIRSVAVERDIMILNRAANVYEEEFGSYPERIEDLVKGKIISAIPVEPFGGVYYIDRKGKGVHSSKVKRRLKIYKPR
jgi:hypothetical protein